MKSPKRLAAVGAGARKGAARVAVPASAKRRLGKSASSAISRKINGTRQTAALRKSSVFSSKTAKRPSKVKKGSQGKKTSLYSKKTVAGVKASLYVRREVHRSPAVLQSLGSPRVQDGMRVSCETQSANSNDAENKEEEKVLAAPDAVAVSAMAVDVPAEFPSSSAEEGMQEGEGQRNERSSSGFDLFSWFKKVLGR